MISGRESNLKSLVQNLQSRLSREGAGLCTESRATVRTDRDGSSGEKLALADLSDQ